MKKDILDFMPLLDRVKLSCLGNDSFSIRIAKDQQEGSRVFLQVIYSSQCTKGGPEDTWRGRKWYLSDYMTDDEVIKTAYTAFKAAVEHEVMEGFKVNGKILFNPHVSFEALLAISDCEVKRKEHDG